MKIRPTSKPGEVVLQLNRGDDRLLADIAIDATQAVSPFQLKRILVPIDFSAPSQKALDYALPFAKQFGAEIILLHVVEPRTYPESFVMPQSYAAPPTIFSINSRGHPMSPTMISPVYCRETGLANPAFSATNVTP